MATYAALTNEQKQIIREHMRMTRTVQGQLARMMNDIVELKGVYDATVGQVVDLLDTGAVIGDNSDLAGAIAVTKESLQGVMAGYATLLADHNTTAKRAVMTAFAGIPNVVRSV